MRTHVSPIKALLGLLTVLAAVMLPQAASAQQDTKKDAVTHGSQVQLDEVTVQTSKIKFYNKGDTVVFNADAFQLAQGAMLDELISRLPGVELRTTGAIYYNGEYVESLLLNGREFFSGNNKIMLENIGAYTVKDIEVYNGETLHEKWLGDRNALRHLTMDVRLKKEYSVGYLGNIQAGYGTDKRYVNRLFGAMFTPTLRLGLVGALNNVSDSRKPGRNDSWTPVEMPSGTRRYTMLGLNYDYLNKQETIEVSGNTYYEADRPDSRTSTYRTNFLPGGDTYDYSFGGSRMRNLKFNTKNFVHRYTKTWRIGGMAAAIWTRRNIHNDNVSATFHQEQEDITRKVLEALYTDPTSGITESLINRTSSRNDGTRTTADLQLFPCVVHKFSRQGSRITDEVGFKYRTQHDRDWEDFRVDYGHDGPAPQHQRNYTVQSPNRVLTLINNLTYRHTISNVDLALNYEYRFIDTRKNSSRYALERLEEMGVYGELPSGWVDAFDPYNSFRSHTLENKHTISPTLSYSMEKREWGLYLRATPDVSYHYRRLSYWRDSRDYPVTRGVWVPSGKVSLSIPWGRQIPRGKLYNRSRNTLVYNFQADTRLPDLLDMVDVINESNPLYIHLGNPDLKHSTLIAHSLMWRWRPMAIKANNNLALNYTAMHNDLASGVIYNSSTGVQTWRMYNVDGNSLCSASDNFNLQFGRRKQFALSSESRVSMNRSTQMKGTQNNEIRDYTVKNRQLSQSLSLSWDLGKQSLAINGSVLDRHTTSTREDFATIDADHYKYGISGVFTLPGGISVSTGFNIYMRRGYGVKELDTTDKIWDMRVAYALGKGDWVISADGFDLLHQLSNVSYSIGAGGRTVVYTNTIPRYMMLSVQYRFNHNPKKLSENPRRARF
ncbi:MAG: hypothetical protein K2K72_01895 [Duncaniella sp.]|nr:hypothetical protein [Duncaniella sp.]